jgi:hypothetical protein
MIHLGQHANLIIVRNAGITSLLPEAPAIESPFAVKLSTWGRSFDDSLPNPRPPQEVETVA